MANPMTTTQAPEGVALLPCPFCGGAATIGMGENAFIDAVARCTECHAEGAIFDDEDAHSIEKNRADATGAWNRRALSVPVNGQGSGSLRPSDCVPGGDEAKTAGQPRGAAK